MISNNAVVNEKHSNKYVVILLIYTVSKTDPIKVSLI